MPRLRTRSPRPPRRRRPHAAPPPTPVHLAEHALRLTPPAGEGTERAPAHARRVPRGCGRAAARDRSADAGGRLAAGGRSARARLAAPGPRAAGDRELRGPQAALERGARWPRPGGQPRGCARTCWRRWRSTRAAEGVGRIHEAEAWALEALATAPRGARRRAARAARAGVGREPARPADRRRLRAVRRGVEAARDIADSPEPVAGLRDSLARRHRTGTSDARRCSRLPTIAGGDVVRLAAAQPVRARVARPASGTRVATARRVGRVGRPALLVTPTYRRCRALLAAGRGLADEAVGVGRARAGGGRRRCC